MKSSMGVFLFPMAWGDSPLSSPLVHGILVSGGVRRKPPYPLLPFPVSPMADPPPNDHRQRPWLGAVIGSAWDVKRLMLIYSTWTKSLQGNWSSQRHRELMEHMPVAPLSVNIVESSFPFRDIVLEFEPRSLTHIFRPQFSGLTNLSNTV